jgi:hypothetical protein
MPRLSVKDSVKETLRRVTLLIDSIQITTLINTWILNPLNLMLHSLDALFTRLAVITEQ